MRPLHTQPPALFSKIVRAHLPADGQTWYATDTLLKEAIDAHDSAIAENLALREENEIFRSRLAKLHGESFGAYQVEGIQPSRFWALVGRENGKRRIAFSFDGPLSDKYVKYVDAEAMERQISALIKGLDKSKTECETFRNLFLMSGGKSA
jgi:hypothetical protein